MDALSGSAESQKISTEIGELKNLVLVVRGWLFITCGGAAILRKLRRFSNRTPTSS